MLVIPNPAALSHDAAAPRQPSHRSTDHAPLQTNTAPEPVLITERQVMFATATAGVASRPVVAPRRWLTTLWQRLTQSVSVDHQPHRHYPSLRPVYFEKAAMSREMERL